MGREPGRGGSGSGGRAWGATPAEGHGRPLSPRAVGNHAGPASGQGQALAKITSDEESKGHGNNPSLSLGVTWQEVLALTEGVGPSRAAQDKQGGRKFPRSQGWRLEPS